MNLRADHQGNPPFRPLFYQRWEDLLFIHWAFDPPHVQERLPAGLKVQTWEGRAWMGVVPFRLTGVQPHGLPQIPVVGRSLELNLRTYVETPQGDAGIYFFSLEANNPGLRLGARIVYRLNYRLARITMTRHAADELEYRSQRPTPDAREVRLRFRRDPDRVTRAQPGSFEEFLIERYRLFAKRPPLDRHITVGRVHHAPYELMPADVLEDGRQIFAANGFAVPMTPPAHVVAARPVTVATDRPRRLDDHAPSSAFEPPRQGTG